MDIMTPLVNLIGQLIRRDTGAIKLDTERSIMLAAKQISQRNRSLERIHDFSDVEFQVYSQWGEDGIIDWLISVLPSMPEIFIEFGVEDYKEANTRYLLQNRNWRGLVIDGSAENMRNLINEPKHWMHDLTVDAKFITKDNIDAIIADNGFAGDIGILSVDIDGNDYWVWEAIRSVNPVIVICEYSAVFGDIHPISIPYAPEFDRLTAHHSGQYAGASIKALIHLAEQKGYTFIGTTSTGVNAFFVRNDQFPHLKDKIAERKIYCTRHRNSMDEERRLTYARGEARLDLIKHLPVVDVVSGETKTIAELGRIYSKDFIFQMRGNRL